MKVKVNIIRTNENKEVNLEKNSLILDLIKKINFKPDTVVVMRGKKPVPVDDEIKNNETLNILHISSSG